MNRACISETINAMETAYTYILENVKPGTPGKLDAVMGLRNNANTLFMEFVNHNIPRIREDRTDIVA